MKTVVRKLIVLTLVLVVTFTVMFIKANQEVDEEAITMGKASIPTISMRQGESYINMLYGYTGETDPKYMRDSVTPVASDRIIRLTVNNCENLILSASYQILNLSGEAVSMKKELTDLNATVETTDISIPLGQEILPDKEYILVLNLKTDRCDSVDYYTRINNITNGHYNEEQEFIYNFSTSTFDKMTAESLISYIEPDNTEDNSNLGKVTIYSSFSQLSWGDLSPERITEPQITYNELIGDIGSFTLEFKVKALNDYGTEQYYNVKEFFRVKWTETEIYLLDYERNMNQIFEAEGQNITSSRINLGIDSDIDVECYTDETGNYIAFENEKSLWLMDTKNNEITSVFSFNNSALDGDARNNNSDNQIKIVEVDKKGNVEFLVCGYMNRGEHEGNVGISLYQYNKENNIVNENLFIPFTRNYQVLKETIGKLLYVNKSNVMYIMLNDSIYSIDLTGNEYVEIISNLRDGCYAIDESNRIIAWETDMSANGSASIEVMNLETNDEYTINAEPGKKIKVQGFLGEDIAYGVADEARIVTDQNGITVVPMSVLKIINMNGEEQKNYSQEGYYFTSTEIKENMINLKRVQYDETGVNLIPTTDYQIFGNDIQEKDSASMSTINTELKQIEVVINFSRKITTAGHLEVKKPFEIKFDNTNILSFRDLISDGDAYYVYGKGRVTAIVDNAADAIVEADKVNGVAINESGNYIWARSSRETEKILDNVGIIPSPDVSGYIASCVNSMLQAEGITSDVSNELMQGKSTIEVINSHLQKGRAVDLSGCTFDEMLYFIDKGKPVLGMLENGNCVLIVGYNFYNSMLLNPGTGQVYRLGQEETSAQFAQNGNRFVCIMN